MWFKDVANPPAMVDLIVSGEVPPAENVLRPLQRLPGTAITALCMLGVFLLNAFLCHELFHREFTERMESIESSYMSVSRWAMDHTERGWFPVWFNGMPFRNVYNPGLPLTVATVARAAGWTAQHSYHFLTALEYCLGPITLFWLCWRVTRSRGFGVTAALLYSLFSPACLFGPLIRADTAHLLTARRFLILVHYGEGPHTTAVMMVPLVILTLHYALTERKLWAIALAPLALAAVVLTNWPGSVGLCMAIAAFLASRLRSERPIHWPLLAGIAVVAYLIACPWIPPSTIALAQRNAQQSDNTVLGATQLIGWALIAVAVLVFHFVFQRVGTDRWLRFFAYFTFITGTVAIGREWFDLRLLPQPYRFQVEFELAFCAVIAYGGKRLYDALPDRWRLVLVCGLTVFLAAQAVKFRRYAESQVRAIDITRTIEYRMAKWFDGHMGGARVFAPGNVSLWMNMFTDTPQVAGCCDQGVPTYEERIATYVIYTGQNAGSRDGEVSLLWLRAYGADAIGISGPKSTEYFHPYWTPGKFEGVLPVLWRDGDNAVYDVQRRSRSLAHVVTPQQLVMRPPVNGLDTADLERYVSAIEAPNAPRANFRWVNTRAGRVEADASAGRVVSVQISYDPGWQATVGGAPRRTFSDALGLLVIDPACQGRCTIDLTWTGGREAKWTKAGQAGGFIVLLGWIAVGLRRQRAATAS